MKIIVYTKIHTDTLKALWIFHNIRNNSHYARRAFHLQLKEINYENTHRTVVNIVRKSQETPQALGNSTQQQQK